jgi:YD repeat-containing protein
MNISLSMRAYLLSGFLALLISASAAADNSWPATWAGDGVHRYRTCQAALDASLDRARLFNGDPLVVLQPTCESATLTSPTPPTYDAAYRRTFDFPTTPNRGVGLAPECVDSGLSFDTARGWICTPSEAMRNIGKCRDRCPVGNPIDPGYGNKFQTEIDYVGSGPFPLRLERVHNSTRGHALYNSAGFADLLGVPSNWTHNYERRLVAGGPTQNNNPQAPPVSLNTAAVSRPDGKSYAFNLAGGVWVPDVDLKGERLEKLVNGWKLTTSEDEIETYNDAGQLVSIANRAGLTQTLTYFASGLNKDLLQTVTDPFGRAMTFTYTNLRLDSISLPGGGQLSYAYATGVTKQLQTVTYPDNSTRTYHYEGPVTGGFDRMLTGITDELGVRYATWVYDYDFFNSPFAGRPTLSQHAGGAGKVTISYTGGVTTVTTFVTPTVTSTRTYGFQTNFGVIANNAITGPACPACGPAQTFYNGATGLLSAWVDWNGNAGNFGLDTTRNLETGRIDGNASFPNPQAPEATFRSYTWHPTFRLQTLITEPLRSTTNSYDPDGTSCGARGALCSKSIQATTNTNGFQANTPVGAPRVWTYTYNASGQVLTANGPRTDVTDVTTYTYDGQGNVATVTNALNQTTQITAYNVHGQPLTLIDANGLTTTLAYDGRQRLTSRSVGGETTTYDYDFAGQLTKVTLPDASFLSYSYDGAHRLTGIQDNLSNRIAYTLDLAGNRTQEQVFDPLNALAQTKSRVYSSLNRLFQEVGAVGQTTEYGYDPQGNVLTVKDPLNRTTTNQYDRHNRMTQVTDPASGLTRYGYNGLHALTQVTDPRNLVTGYTIDGLGNLNQQASPDTGSTVNTYDLAGNLATQTDAKGQVTTYAYDAMNRVSLITFHDGSKQAYAYDQGTNGVGRLSSITETNPANVTTSVIAYAYEQHGRVTSETRTVNGVAYVLAYTYDASGRLTGMTYPSGRSVTYTLDALGRVNQVTTTKDSLTQVVAQNVQYFPFGGVSGYTAGNGRVVVRGRDQDGRIASYSLGLTQYTVGYDAASRITGIVEVGNPANTNTYGYDTLDRLTSAILTSSNFAYSYDGVGNRLTKTVGANTDTYTYGSTSNRIATLTPSGSPLRSFTLDADGSTTADGLNSYAYDTRGRMVQSTNAASTVTSYQVNALGQRIRKTNSQDDRIFTYDTWGKLIAESDPGGAIKRELIYLGDLVIGRVQQ